MAAPLKLKPIHPIASILGHLRLIAGITVVGTVLLVGLILWRVKPVYEAVAALEITQSMGHVLTRDQDKQIVSRIQYTDYVNTQVNYLVGFENVAAALAKVDLTQTPVVQRATEAETVQGFLGMLQVGWVPNTNLLSISVRAADPRGLDQLANALMDTYLATYHLREASGAEASIARLREEEKVRKADLADMTARLGDYTRRLGTLSREESLTPLEENLGYLRQALNGAYVARLEAEHVLHTLLQRLDKENVLGIESLVEERVLEDLTEMRNEMYEDMAELRRASSQMNPDHPYMKQLEDRIEGDRANLDKAMEDLRNDAARVIGDRLDRDDQAALIKARAEVDSRVRNEKVLQEKYAAVQAELNTVIPLFLQADQLRNDIDQTRLQLGQIGRRLEELSIEAGALGRIHIQARAREPLYPTKNRRRLFAVMALLFCACVGLAAALALDFLEPSIISPQHMAQLIGRRPTGVLALQEGGRFGQLLRQAPESYDADQFRRIMPRIFRTDPTREAPTAFALLPLTPGAGATAFGLNCLTHHQTLGHAAGLLVLTDASRLTQRVADWHLVEQQLKLPDHLAAKFPLTLLAGGGLELYSFKTNPGKGVLADQTALAELIDLLAARTGCLLVETPSLLQHAEAEMVVRLTRTAVLVVDGPATSPGELTRGMGLLEDLQPEAVAVIANKLPVLPGGYFAEARAAFEGREMRSPLLHAVKTAVADALRPGRRS